MRTYSIRIYRELRREGFAPSAAIFYARKARVMQLMKVSR